MHSLKVYDKRDITEGAATEAIFNACRGNGARVDRRENTLGGVTFERLYGFVYVATLRDAGGVLLAKAIIDEYDV